MKKAKSGAGHFFPTRKKKKRSAPRDIRFSAHGSWRWPESGKKEIDYRNCSLKPAEWLGYGMAGLAAAALIAALFYRSLAAWLALGPIFMLALPLRMRKTKAFRQKEALAKQFRDGILAVSSAVNAGYAIENAWQEAALEMAQIYGEGGEITREARDKVDRLLKTHFRPEFLNRIDEIVCYKPLTRTEIASIVNLMVKSLNARMAEKQLQVQLTDQAVLC